MGKALYIAAWLLGVWAAPYAMAQPAPQAVEHEQLVQMQESLQRMQQQIEQMQRSQGAQEVQTPLIQQRQAHRRAMMQHSDQMHQGMWGRGCCMGCGYMGDGSGIYPDQSAPLTK